MVVISTGQHSPHRIVTLHCLPLAQNLICLSVWLEICEHLELYGPVESKHLQIYPLYI